MSERDFKSYYVEALERRKEKDIESYSNTGISSRVYNLDGYQFILMEVEGVSDGKPRSIKEIDDMEYHPLIIPHFDSRVRKYLTQVILSAKYLAGAEEITNIYKRNQTNMYKEYKNGSKDYVLIIGINDYKIILPKREFDRY